MTQSMGGGGDSESSLAVMIMYYLPYLVVFLAGLIYVLQQLCQGYYVVDSSFSYSNTYPEPVKQTLDGYTKEIVLIPVQKCPYKSILHAWLLKPLQSNNLLPVIVMSHGLGSQKDMGLENYGKVFTSLGYAVLIIDYRHFGGSTTLSACPVRNLIYPWYHRDDIVTAVQYITAGNLQQYLIDSNQIVLWGTSFAGGHVITAAVSDAVSQSKAVKAIISQAPHLDGRAASKRVIKDRGLLGTIRTACLALGDMILSQLGYATLYIKIAGKKGEIAYMTMTEEQLNMYFSKHPPIYLGGWRNLAPARTLLLMSFYNPKDDMPQLREQGTPILFIAAEQDELCPASSIISAFDQVGNKASMISLNCTHFDIYGGDQFKKATAAMQSFLAEHVPIQANK